MRSQWGRYNLPICIYILHDISWLTSEQALAMMPYFLKHGWYRLSHLKTSGHPKKKELHVFNTRVIYLLKWKKLPKQSNYNAPNRNKMPQIVIECYTWSSHSNVDLYGISHCCVYFMEGNCMARAVWRFKTASWQGQPTWRGARRGFWHHPHEALNACRQIPQATPLRLSPWYFQPPTKTFVTGDHHSRMVFHRK